jgi:hypothetical protein
VRLNAGDIVAVLLADGRHEIEVDSFDVTGGTTVLADVVVDEEGLWFRFAEQGTGESFAGPMSSVLAVVLDHEAALTRRMGAAARDR